LQARQRSSSNLEGPKKQSNDRIDQVISDNKKNLFKRPSTKVFSKDDEGGVRINLRASGQQSDGS